MPSERLILILNDELPRDLRKALDREAKAEDVTVNDVAGSILAQHYGLEWPLSGAPFRDVSLRFKLRVTPEIRRALHLDAADGMTKRGVALEILAKHYGTKDIDPHRRRRKEVA